MAHTNSTSNYGFSQFIGTDKPTFLGDYNGDMQKIDAAIKGAKDTADGASTTANAASALATSASETATQAATDAASASANATTALNTANGATTTANSAMSTATSAATTASDASTTATAAKTEAEAATAAVALKPSYSETFARMFNMTSSEVTTSIIAGTGITIGATSHVYVAKNTDVSLGKVYGVIEATMAASTGYTDITLCTIPLGLTTISTQFDIAGFSGVGLKSDNSTYTGSFKLRFKTDGNVDVISWGTPPNTVAVYPQLPPCLLVLTDFGD